MPKNNTGKKMSIVRDELEIKGAGLYCFLPFENLDKKKKGIFKVGLATNSFSQRIEQYHTYFPLGVYMCAFIENPPIPRSTRSNKDGDKPKKIHYQAIEKFILKYIDDNGGTRIYSTTRVKNPNLNNEGETEWVYTNEKLIHQAFTEAQKKYGGKLRLFYLEGLDPETNQFTSINQIARDRGNQQPNYTGKIIYHL